MRTGGGRRLPRGCSLLMQARRSSFSGTALARLYQRHPGPGCADGFRRDTVDLSRIDESERRIYLTTQNFGCSFPETASILESEGTIALTLHGKAPAGPCTQELLIAQTFIQLTSPINGRQVIVDGQ